MGEVEPREVAPGVTRVPTGEDRDAEWEAAGKEWAERHGRAAGVEPPDGVDEIVAQWGRERPDLDTLPMAVFGRIFRLAKAGGDATEKAYARFGIGRPEFDVLATLRRSGPPYELSPGALAGSMMLSSGGTTARLDRLERAGLVERVPSPTDRRSVLVRLTDAGRDVIEDAVGAGLAEQARLLRHMEPEKVKRLSELLREALRSS